MIPLRVLHVIGGDDTGGAMSYVLPLLSALRAQGCDAHLLCLGPGGLARSADRRGLPVTVLPMSHAWDARMLPALRRDLASGEWHVVHSHGMRANLPVRLALPMVAGRPLLFTTIHSDLTLDYSDVTRARGYALIDRLTRPLVDGFCCVSEDLAHRLTRSGVPAAKIHVVHPGIEVPDPTVIRAAKPVSGRSPTAAPGGVVGTVARLVEVKDLGLLLDAVSMLAERVPGARAVIVGDGPERHRLESRASEKGLEGRVEFPGQLRSVWPALAQLDVFVITSRYEGVPFSVLEAMTMGLPVVATAVGGLPEAVEDGVTGFLVQRSPDPKATAAALSARMAELLLDRSLRERMGAAGRSRAADQFSSLAAGRRTLRIYERTLAEAEPRPGRAAVARWGIAAAEARGPGSPAVSVLGFRLDLVNLEEAAQWVVAMARPGRLSEADSPSPGPTAIAVSFNPELVMTALRDPVAAEALRCADLAYPDGVGAVWAARRGLARGPSAEGGVERVAGIDLAQRVLELAASSGLSVYFLGAKPGVAEEAAARQRRQLPGLQVAGCRDGYFSPSEEGTVVAEVRRSGAAILLVAMGAPRQETLLHRYRDHWGVGVALGVGGSLDVWAGKTMRAPDWVRKAGVEWLYRLTREPRRLRRQLVLPRYVFRVVTGPTATAGVTRTAVREEQR